MTMSIDNHGILILAKGDIFKPLLGYRAGFLKYIYFCALIILNKDAALFRVFAK